MVPQARSVRGDGTTRAHAEISETAKTVSSIRETGHRDAHTGTPARALRS